MSCHLVTNAGSVDPACVAFVPGQFGRTQGVWRKRRRPHCCRTNGETPHYLIETFISLTCIHTSKALTRCTLSPGALDNRTVFQHNNLCASRCHCTWEAGKTVKWTEALAAPRLGPHPVGRGWGPRRAFCTEVTSLCSLSLHLVTEVELSRIVVYPYVFAHINVNAVPTKPSEG